MYNKRIFLNISMILIILFPGINPLLGGIVEEVEVTGKLFSDEPHSKNTVIITAADLEELKIKDMSELFSFFTALDVSKRGAGESSFDITMRGGNFEQVLLLVDGVPLNNPQTGHFNCDFPFSIQDVERIEIVRGGSSTTYGSGAFAGAVHIVLKKMGKKTDLHFNASGGENKFYSTSLYAGKRFNNLAFRVSVDKNKSDGYYKGREFNDLKLTAGAFYASEKTEIDIHTGYLQKSFGAAGFYAPFPSQEETATYFSRLSWKQTFRRTVLSLAYSYNRHEDYFVLDRDRPAYFTSDSATDLHFTSLSGSYRGSRLTVTLGGEFKGEYMDSTTMGTRRRNRGAAFANANYRLTGKGGVDAGFRRNFETSGNSNYTYYAGFYHNLGRELMFRASYGKSFRLPSFTELFYMSPANTGNPSLKPEVSHNYEVSLSLLKAGFQTDLSLFFRNQNDVIDWIRFSNDSGEFSPWLARNLSKNDIAGIEFTHRFRFKKTIVSLGVERLFAVNRHDGIKSKYGLRFPDFRVKAGVVQPISKYVKIAANYTFKQIYNTAQQGHFMNLVLTLPFRQMELSLRMDNLFNEIIEEVPGLPVPGRWIYVGFSYKY